MSVIYLDNNATTKVDDEVITTMVEAYNFPINASAIHQLGRKGYEIVEKSRKSIKDLINANNYDVIFTGTATEATNLALYGCGSQKILRSALEHAATYNCQPENKEIIEIDALSNGIINVDDIKNKLDASDSDFIISVMLANSEIGSIQPISDIAKLVHQKGGLIHCDIVQAVGKIEIDLEKLNVDFATISAHKLNGPQGVGALLMRKGLDIKPLIYGGSQENAKRAGTTNVAGIAGFGKACELAKDKPKKYQKVKELRDYLEKELTKIAKNDIKIFGLEIDRLPNTSYISLAYADAQAQLINFDLNNICVSAGSACSSGSNKASRVLKSIKATPDFIDSAIRVSLGIENTKDEIDKFISVWSEFYKRHKS
ncbi:MAG: cysteine desulfurase [Rickettsiales bacterium]|nr:cysteine desulfurase [Rickettsiales bacterium]